MQHNSQAVIGTGMFAPEDVLRIAFVRDASLSAGGDVLAYSVFRTDPETLVDRECVVVAPVSLRGPAGATRSIGDASWPRWSPSGSRLAIIGSGDRHGALIMIDAHGRETHFELPGPVIGPAAWSPDDRFIAVVLAVVETDRPAIRHISSNDYRADGLGFIGERRHALWIVDTDTATARELPCGLGYSWQPVWHPSGSKILLLGTESPIPGAGYSPGLYSIDPLTGERRRLLDEVWNIRSACWLPDGSGIAFVGAHDCSVTVPVADVWTLDPDTGETICRSAPVRARTGCRVHHDMPLWGAPWSDSLVVRDDGTILATVQIGGDPQIWAFPTQDASVPRRLIDGSDAAQLLAIDRSGETLLFLAGTALSPPDLWLFQDGRRLQLTAFNEDLLAAAPRFERRHLRVKAPDGLEMEAWFIARADAALPAPTILFIHGGPFIATGNMFRFDHLMLASQGFAVLAANFRGSYGYGEDFAQAIVGNWGAKGFPDHIAAIDEAIVQGLADPARLGVWGASHGGYATCWVVTQSNRFRAAIAEAAVTSMTTAYYLSDAPDLFARDLGGKPGEVPEAYAEASPMTHAANCTTPTMLLHGERDLRCPISEAEQFFRALLDAGCITEMMRLRDADHMGDSMGPPAMRVEQNRALVRWFGRFLR